MTRKLWQANGAGLVQLQKVMGEDFAKAQHPVSKQLIAELQPYLLKLQKLIPVIGAELAGENQNALLANASCFLTIFGQVVMSWMWIRQAITSEEALNNNAVSQDDEAFYRGKLQAAKYFLDWELPLTDRDFKVLSSMSDSCSAMQETWF